MTEVERQSEREMVTRMIDGLHVSYREMSDGFKAVLIAKKATLGWRAAGISESRHERDLERIELEVTRQLTIRKLDND